MELNVRDWLIILGSLVAAGFILDAYRRVRAGYTDKLRLSAKQRDDEDELVNPELPGGGARVVSRVAPRSKAVPSYDKPADNSGGQSDDAPVPVLMDSVDEPEPPQDTLDAAAKDTLSAEESLGELAHAPGQQAEEPVVKISETDTKATKPATAATSNRDKPEPKARGEQGGEKPGSQNPEEIIVLHVVAGEGGELTGNALLQILLACDVRYGRMNIFHRYEEPGGAGAEQFSVVNMLAPGTFDLDDMDNFSSPGVSFFMRLPGPKDAIKAFDCMVETAQVLVKNLGCELQDEARSVCTAQTLQHLRQRIRDFERRQLTLV